MTILTQSSLVLEDLLKELELPDWAYDKAKARYDDLGSWLNRDASVVKVFDPHVFSQGSFRLGTVIRPVNPKEEYDLDLACKLRAGIAKSSSTQEELKQMVGKELENYRIARNITKKLEEKHRCWRLEYQDNLDFHMDVVPCIPENEIVRSRILESMRKIGSAESFAEMASKTAVSITDNRHPSYHIICDDWKISNPEGYATWFEDRMRTTDMMIALKEARVDEVPTYKRKTPLQRAVQLLKRHRDQMFRNNADSKPISIIITTLAARAYKGEADVASAIQRILTDMGGLINVNSPRVPNPVDPAEDFADKWSMPRYAHLQLETNFWNWLQQARADFQIMSNPNSVKLLEDQALQKFAVRLNAAETGKKLGLSVEFPAPALHTLTERATPWSGRIR